MRKKKKKKTKTMLMLLMMWWLMMMMILLVVVVEPTRLGHLGPPVGMISLKARFSFSHSIQWSILRKPQRYAKQSLWRKRIGVVLVHRRRSLQRREGIGPPTPRETWGGQTSLVSFDSVDPPFGEGLVGLVGLVGSYRIDETIWGIYIILLWCGGGCSAY